LQLAGRLPAAIVADLLGVHVTTATQWAELAGRPWGDYPALRSSQLPSGPDPRADDLLSQMPPLGARNT
jgi:hypothetical protein